MSRTETSPIVTTGPHLWGGPGTGRIMSDLLLALIPAVLGAVYFFGSDALAVVLVSTGTAAAVEWVTNRWLGRRSTLADGSALVTGLLLALNLPAGVPLWLPAVGAFFAIAIVKQAFGGLGYNLVNPALAARAFLLIGWPTQMTTWPAPPDAVSMATPLAVLTKPLALEATVGAAPGYLDLLVGRVGGSLGETSALLLLIGAAYLLYRRVIDWRIPVAIFGTVAILTWILGGRGGPFQGDALYHLLAGGLILGAFYMATDYVTAPITPRGRWIFGIGVGLVTVLIRLYGSFPEGVSFAILFMNLMTPLLDRLTVPRPFGGARE